MQKNYKGILDIIGSAIDTIFENSSLKHPCIRSRHITQLLYCPHFMNQNISFIKNPSMIESYIKEFMIKVLAWMKKRGDNDDLILLSHANLIEKLQQLHIFLQTHQPYQLYYGLTVYKTEGRKSRTYKSKQRLFKKLNDKKSNNKRTSKKK